MRYKFGAVVHPQVKGNATACGSDAVKNLNDLVGINWVINFDREGFAGELVDDVQHFDCASIGEGVEPEIECPQHVRADRAHRPHMGPDSGETLFTFLLRHTQAFIAP